MFRGKDGKDVLSRRAAWKVWSEASVQGGEAPKSREPYWILKDKQDLGCEKTKKNKNKGGREFRQREEPVLRARSKVHHSTTVGMSSGKCKLFHMALAKFQVVNNLR